MTNRKVIHIEPQAAPKPALGAACNGCGVCCLYQPCPLGMLISGKRLGPCAALQWDPPSLTYRCGAITSPSAVLNGNLAPGLKWLAVFLTPWLKRSAKRWIAAGKGCDCSLEVEPTRNLTDNSSHDGSI